MYIIFIVLAIISFRTSSGLDAEDTSYLLSGSVLIKGIKEMKMKIDFEAEEIIVNDKNYPFINTQRSTMLHTIKKATIPPLSIHTIEVEGDLSQAVYSIEENCQNTPIQVIE